MKKQYIVSELEDIDFWFAKNRHQVFVDVIEACSEGLELPVHVAEITEEGGKRFIRLLLPDFQDVITSLRKAEKFFCEKEEYEFANVAKIVREHWNKNKTP